MPDNDAAEELGVMGTPDCGVFVAVDIPLMDELDIECKRLTGVCISTTSFLFRGVNEVVLVDPPDFKARGSGLSSTERFLDKGV
jgi:hypothetical protein